MKHKIGSPCIMDALDIKMIHTLVRIDKDRIKFHHIPQNGMQFKLKNCLFLEHSMQWHYLLSDISPQIFKTQLHQNFPGPTDYFSAHTDIKDKESQIDCQMYQLSIATAQTVENQSWVGRCVQAHGFVSRWDSKLVWNMYRIKAIDQHSLQQERGCKKEEEKGTEGERGEKTRMNSSG